ncbi:MAG: hypothetical protein MI867_12570 [Pseudomonadales bacterium]|nr:hypothetical protein [Pseudomonadales bacterium]
MVHRVLGVDLGRTLGWAYAENAVLRYSGEVALAPNDGGYADKKFIAFWNFLNDFNNVDEVVYEDVRAHPRRTFNPRTQKWESGQNIMAAHAYGGYKAILLLWCGRNDIKALAIKPTELKKQFTGKGNAKKLMMCEEARKRGWQGGVAGTDKNDNEADARALVHVALENRKIDVIVEQ